MTEDKKLDERLQPSQPSPAEAASDQPLEAEKRQNEQQVNEAKLAEPKANEAKANEPKQSEPKANEQKPKEKDVRKKEKSTSRALLRIILAALIAAMYVVLTLPMASISYGIIQFRLAEALSVLAAFTGAAIPGLFLGCLISNFLQPNNLGIVDILGGSAATLLAALLSWFIARGYRKRLKSRRESKAEDSSAEMKKLTKLRHWLSRILILLPPVLVNAVVVGSYLPFLLLEHHPSQLEIAGSIVMIFLSQTVVIYGIGLFLLLGLEKLPLPWDKM